jgi:glycosyltransferase involved in cell wall biosynthesis
MASIVMIISYPDVRLQKEAEALAQNNMDVDVIVWERGWSFPRNDERYTVRSLRFKHAPFGKLSALLFFPLWWLFIFRYLIASDYQAIHAVNLDTFVLALLIGKCRRKKVIYDVFDFYADMLVLPALTLSARDFITRADRYLMKFADGIIIADESRTEQIQKSLSERVIVVTNSPKREWCEKVTLPKKKTEDFTLFVGGGVSLDRGVHTLITAVQQLDNVQLVVMGYCNQAAYAERLKQMCAGTTNITLGLEGVPYETIIAQTLVADLIVALYDPHIPNNRYASPNKLFEAMMCGKPILVSEDTSMAALVRKENCGLVAPFADLTSIKEAISSLKSNPSLWAALGENGKRAYDTKYDWKLMEKRLVDLYLRILPSGPSNKASFVG